MRELANRHGATPGQVALAWLLARSERAIPIPGTKRLSYLEENCAAVLLRLDAEEVVHLAEVFHPGAIAGDRYTPEGMKGITPELKEQLKTMSPQLMLWRCEVLGPSSAGGRQGYGGNCEGRFRRQRRSFQQRRALWYIEG